MNASEQARERRAKAAEVDPPAEAFTRIEMQTDAAHGRAAALWQAREEAIVSVKSAFEIARIDDHRARVDAELAELETERQGLVELAEKAAELRAQAADQEAAATGFRAEEANRRARIAVLPEMARKQAVALHEQERRLQDQRRRAP